MFFPIAYRFDPIIIEKYAYHYSKEYYYKKHSKSKRRSHRNKQKYSEYSAEEKYSEGIFQCIEICRESRSIKSHDFSENRAVIKFFKMWVSILGLWNCLELQMWTISRLFIRQNET